MAVHISLVYINVAERKIIYLVLHKTYIIGSSLFLVVKLRMLAFVYRRFGTTFKIGRIGCPETSLNNNQHTQRNNSYERKPSFILREQPEVSHKCNVCSREWPPCNSSCDVTLSLSSCIFLLHRNGSLIYYYAHVMLMAS
jgi:hypothetical protein